MHKFTLITATALAGAGLGLGAGIAHAAPAGPASVSETISNLKASGYTVVVDSVGTGEECSLLSVRPGQTYSKTDSGTPGGRGDHVYQLLSKTVYVSVSC